MENNNLLLTATLVILGVALFSPSLTGNYQYGNQCGSPGESFCAPGSTERQGIIRECVQDPRSGKNVWSAPVSCPPRQICINRQLSATQTANQRVIAGNTNVAECVYPYIPKAL